MLLNLQWPGEMRSRTFCNSFVHLLPLSLGQGGSQAGATHHGATLATANHTLWFQFSGWMKVIISVCEREGRWGIFSIRNAVFFQLCCSWCALTAPAATSHRLRMGFAMSRKAGDGSEALGFQLSLQLGCAAQHTCSAWLAPNPRFL